MSATHEDFTREIGRPGPSDRNFGFVFAAAFLLFGLLPLRHGKPIRPWWLVASAAVLLITLIRPSLLHFANTIWTKIGLLLGKVVNPIVTALLFFVVFTPIAVVLRLMGKDLMMISFDRGTKTYWSDRQAWNERADMSNQF
jgi:hypothetical protein